MHGGLTYLSTRLWVVIRPGLLVGSFRRSGIQACLCLLRVPVHMNPLLRGGTLLLVVPVAFTHGIGRIIRDLQVG